MGTFTSEKILYGNPKYIPVMGERICQEFARDGFETNMEDMAGGGVDISLAKGGKFKAALGMKSALKVTIAPRNGTIHIKAGVGIFGQQLLPSAITVLVFWPVIVAQVWGMVQQSKLDDRAIALAEDELAHQKEEAKRRGGGFAAAPGFERREAPPEYGRREAPPEFERREVPPENGRREAPPANRREEAAVEYRPEEQPRARFCTNCGAPLSGGNFCASCGAKVE